MAAWQDLVDQLLRERGAALIGYAALLTGDRSSGEDLVHDAVVRTFGRPRSFPSLNAADAYVRRAIVSAFVDGVRSRRRRMAAMTEMAADAVVRDDDVAGRLDARAALRTLPQRQRACVVLRFYDDLTVGEIAGRLGVSDGAVKRYLSDGIHALNTMLGTAADVADVCVSEVRVGGGGPR